MDNPVSYYDYLAEKGQFLTKKGAQIANDEKIG